MARHLVHALPELRVLVGQELGADALVARRPGPAAVVGAIDAAGRDGDEHPAAVLRVRDDRVQAQAAAARLPLLAVRMLPESLDELERLPRVARLEESGGLDAAVDHVG